MIHPTTCKIGGWPLLVAAAACLCSCDANHAPQPGAPAPTPPLNGGPPPSPLPHEPTVFASVQLQPWCAVCVDATSAVVTLDGEPASLADLREGDVVLQYGARTVSDYGDAFSWWKIGDVRPPFISHINSTTLLQGPVDSIDLQRAVLVVMGQAVQFLDTAVNSTGPTSAAALNSIAVGDTVRISGYRSINDRILATRIDHADSNAPARIMGKFETGAGYLRIGNLNVDVSGAAAPDHPGGLAAGDVVAVRGEFDAAGDLLRADSVRAYAPLADFDDYALVSMTGLSSEYTDYGRTEIAFVDQIFRDRYCDYDYYGFEWGPDQLTQLQGFVASAGIVDVICYLGASPHDEPDFGRFARAVSGPVEEIDHAQQTLTILGTRVSLNFATRLGLSGSLSDFSDNSYKLAPLSALEIGNYASITGFAGFDNEILAHTIVAESYEPSSDKLKFFGTPDNLQFPLILMSGQLIATTENTTFRDFRDVARPAMSREEYFSGPPDTSEIIVTLSDTGLFATEVRLWSEAPQ